MAYREVGVTQFILSGWSNSEEVERFGKMVLPLVRELEEQRFTAAAEPARP